MSNYNAFQVVGQFGLNNLQKTQVPTGQPLKPDEVRLKVLAVSLNYRDLLVVEGSYNPRQTLPFTPCCDACCEVIEVGQKVQDFKVGDKVIPTFATDWIEGPPRHPAMRNSLGSPLEGTLRHEMIVPQHGLSHAPSHLDPGEASTLPCAGVTAWSALFNFQSFKPQDTAVILGTGGVSMWATKIARILDLNTIVLTSSPQKEKLAKEWGANHTINYRDAPEWSTQVRELTDKKGAEFILEVGGAKTLKQSLKVAAPHGLVALIGVLSGFQEPINILPILMKQIQVQGVLVGSRFDLRTLIDFSEKHQIKPHISHRFAFSESEQAFQTLKKGLHIGKVVIDFSL